MMLIYPIDAVILFENGYYHLMLITYIPIFWVFLFVNTIHAKIQLKHTKITQLFLHAFIILASFTGKRRVHQQHRFHHHLLQPP